VGQILISKTKAASQFSKNDWCKRRLLAFFWSIGRTGRAAPRKCKLRPRFGTPSEPLFSSLEGGKTKVGHPLAPRRSIWRSGLARLGLEGRESERVSHSLTLREKVRESAIVRDPVGARAAARACLLSAAEREWNNLKCFNYFGLGNGSSKVQNLAVAGLYVPSSLDSGERWGARDRGLQTTVYVSGSDPDPVAAGPDPAVSASHTRGSHVCIYL